ncbi:hypothetical protein DFH06DRAFT_205875 [Mycena polygramma]|nr:hypothetical protein DFH06DRAFT_205875 [Mycena polygramma]
MSSVSPDLRRSTIWYKDGSVVLQAQDTQFRVHWGVLAQASAFFHDLSGLPQPTDQPNVDGCPVIEISDLVADVECLLTGLYNPGLFNQKALPFPYIASFVRLGRKYDFKDLFDIAVERLAFENPTTLEEYTALGTVLSTAAGKRVSHSTTRIVNYRGIHYDMLELARENDLLALLPCAYFRVARLSLESIFEEIQRPDGTTCALSSMDRAICTRGHERLQHAQWKPDNTLSWVVLWKCSDNCAEHKKCDQARESVLRSILFNPAVYAFIVIEEIQKYFCAGCAKMVGTSLATGQGKMWENLPSFFELPPWQELKSSNER